MAEIKRKKTFGSATIDHVSPKLPQGAPKTMNIHLSLGQLLGHLNGYNRSTKAGKRASVNLCVYGENRIAVIEGRLMEVADRS